jgi:hypothetical protein
MIDLCWATVTPPRNVGFAEPLYAQLGLARRVRNAAGRHSGRHLAQEGPVHRHRKKCIEEDACDKSKQREITGVGQEAAANSRWDKHQESALAEAQHTRHTEVPTNCADELITAAVITAVRRAERANGQPLHCQGGAVCLCASLQESEQRVVP